MSERVGNSFFNRGRCRRRRGLLIAKWGGCIVFSWLLGVLGGLRPLLGVEPGAVQGGTMVIVTGAEGNPEYGAVLAGWSNQWRQLAAAAGVRCVEVGPPRPAGEGGDLAKLKQLLNSASGGAGGEEGEGLGANGAEPLWIVLLGHGTSDGRTPRFNLRGKDLQAAVLAEWLKDVQRPVVVVAGFSSAGAFLKPLSSPERVIVTATKSGGESNFARFGGVLPEVLLDPKADLDKDGQTTLLEGWIVASQRVEAFYEGQGRIATEHSLLEDNADGLGTPASWYAGLELRQVAKEQRQADGIRANQMCLVPSPEERAMPPQLRARRDALERELSELKGRKTSLGEQEYAVLLEEILLKIGRIYREADEGRVP
jgi:hypothetical protein